MVSDVKSVFMYELIMLYSKIKIIIDNIVIFVVYESHE